MAIVQCPECHQPTPDLRPVGKACGAPLTEREAQRQASAELARERAARTGDAEFASWQRSVVVNVVGGGGVPGTLLVITTVLVCAAGAYGPWFGARLPDQLVAAGPFEIPGLLLAVAGVGLGVLYFTLAAPLFYRLRRRW